MRTRKFLSTLIPALPMLLTALLVILVTVIFLTAMRSKAHAQFGGVEQPMFQLTSQRFVPPNQGTLFWWVATDLADGNFSTWTDRNKGLTLTVGGVSTTLLKSGDYVQMTGTNYLTNRVTSTGSVPRPYSFYYILKLNGAAAQTLGPVITGTYPGRLHFGAGPDWLWWPGTQVLADTIATNVIKDFGLGVDGGGVGAAWTNGISSGAMGAADATLSPLFCIGTAGTSSSFRGLVYEVFLWTNYTITISDMELLHNYATNTYGFSP